MSAQCCPSLGIHIKSNKKIGATDRTKWYFVLNSICNMRNFRIHALCEHCWHRNENLSNGHFVSFHVYHKWPKPLQSEWTAYPYKIGYTTVEESKVHRNGYDIRANANVLLLFLSAVMYWDPSTQFYGLPQLQPVNTIDMWVVFNCFAGTIWIISVSLLCTLEIVMEKSENSLYTLMLI